MFIALALVAASVEAMAGYPDALVRRIGHPVTWIGRLISWGEGAWNSPDLSYGRRRGAGVALLLLLIAVSVAAGLAISGVAAQLLPPTLALLFCGVLASSLLAQRSLHSHVAAVATALERDGLEAGRRAVSMVVGRDTQALGDAAVGRAAIESLAENFSDGVVAPLLWMAVAGLPGAIAYKAINTADSMIGHKSERYRAFGWASARCDDLVNLPASRLSALWLALAAALRGGKPIAQVLATVRRDAGRHRSPNAGWPEAAMAAALGIRLAGPRVYGGVAVEDPWMGDGRSAVTPRDIRAALALYRTACGLQVALLLALLLTLLALGVAV
ncbi:adenosylcobinamide-phosphate synthase CbiB [Reyranella sp.]|jgi:adenosylcobinamide-phosphate synthase|uniref:adenosylcobinamide-phosphate synthase CbiB n=1 Tax=Reyranella sp. TaxID=1929291 RepID=UPI000BCB2227|nr:adenosylcobinamide-phosphate synthase CbiB [Reyranella sp.]OYY33857.1 MAG: cobalamin biosynthesis protein CobD [Rhodospirillales bacterium 35-66-84]OYZ90861.1 MAG: cobalamin biosynthesis protein CobD [Rhodospirillales bacterium 24-66-33]OZB21196.1 MAG: cobalamin biosynthesis protein CobD [Rhodospirillales bacterium 39-66-50]HQS19250.1 adenosylcobinamide-phosphate synthase CbiB [Reyranella sp.]HQT15547.1 adenosylcobinamide-phosphate synthase CbiB [Reyranella sp.]|tara:strand:+ start:68 stop:1054 length:987 start_codon:yes stop_codon:yes gene_type:complete